MPSKSTKKSLKQSQRETRPEDDLIKFLIAKSNKLQLVEAGAASCTIWDVETNEYKSYFVTAVSQAALKRFSDGTYTKCQIQADGEIQGDGKIQPDDDKTKARISQIFEAEVRRNSDWFTNNRLDDVPEDTYVDDNVSVSVVEYKTAVEEKENVVVGDEETKYRVLTSQHVGMDYKSFNLLAKDDILKAYVKLGINDIEKDDGTTVAVAQIMRNKKVKDQTRVAELMRPLAERVAVAIERFQNRFQWYHNDITPKNVFVKTFDERRKADVGILDIKLIDVAPFSNKEGFGSKNNPSVSDFVDGTASAFFLQKCVLGNPITAEKIPLYKKYRLGYNPDGTAGTIVGNINEVDAVCELSRIATYQTIITETDKEKLDELLQYMLAKYNAELLGFKQQTAPPPDTTDYTDYSLSSESDREPEVDAASESEVDDQASSPVSTDDAISENARKTSVPKAPRNPPSQQAHPKAPRNRLSPPAPGPSGLPRVTSKPTDVVSSDKSEEQTYTDEEEDTKVNGKSAVSDKPEEETDTDGEEETDTDDGKSAVSDKTQARFQPKQNNSHLPLKNSEKERKRTFERQTAESTMKESISEAWNLSNPTIKKKYPDMVKKIAFLKNKWKEGVLPHEAGIWQAVEDLSRMYDKTFVSCEPPEKGFSEAEKKFIVAIYKLIAHSSNFRAEKYAWKTDVDHSDIIFNCL
jgi:hypothetical protein